MKIKSVHYDNRRKAFRVVVSRRTYWFPYPKAHPRPSSKNLVASVYVDEELGNEAFTYELASGQEGTVHIDQVLDPTNYAKSIDQLTALLAVLDCEVELVVKSQSRAAVPAEVS